jgi:hypothetical protein
VGIINKLGQRASLRCFPTRKCQIFLPPCNRMPYQGHMTNMPLPTLIGILRPDPSRPGIHPERTKKTTDPDLPKKTTGPDFPKIGSGWAPGGFRISSRWAPGRFRVGSESTQGGLWGYSGCVIAFKFFARSFSLPPHYEDRCILRCQCCHECHDCHVAKLTFKGVL